MKRSIRLPSPNKPLYDFQILYYVKRYNIPKFRGIFCRDDLPKKPFLNECGIVNLDSKIGNGTHWTAYWKTGNVVIYFDPLGNVAPPRNFIKYFSKCHIYYNHESKQKINAVNCGHLCLKFLLGMMKK